MLQTERHVGRLHHQPQRLAFRAPRKSNCTTVRPGGSRSRLMLRRTHQRSSGGSISSGLGSANAQRAPHSPRTSITRWSSSPPEVSRYSTARRRPPVCRSITPVASNRRSRYVSNEREIPGSPR
jgi:hypothetical protein